MSNLQIPIVVVAFNRPDSLLRILSSLTRCVYPQQVKLIISIDGGSTQEVIDMASQFDWNHGDKEVLCHSDNMGLRAHILKCGQLALKYDGIVLLEDDLYVSRYFYQYLLAVQDKYKNDKNISGVALYSPMYSETACLPFMPIEDGHDVYFMQLACSWGQSWLSQQWLEFESWYKKNKSLVLQEDSSIPPNVQLWPDTSWKKYFIKYNIENNKFFAYPRSSFTTNFADTGENHTKTKLWQVPLSVGNGSTRLPEFEESLAKYDAFCEILPESLKNTVAELEGYDFTVDLYGVRDKDAIQTEYVLSRNKFSDHLFSFGCEIKPHELNIIDGIEGEHFKLGRTQDMRSHVSFLGHRYRIFTDYKETQDYFYAITPEHLSVFAEDTCKAWKKEQDEAADLKQSQEFTHGQPAEQLEQPSNLMHTSNELLADIEYLTAAVSGEMTDFKNHFNSVIEGQLAGDLKLNLVINEVSGSLAKFSSKINVIERALKNNKIDLPNKSFGEVMPDRVGITYPSEITISACELTVLENIEPLEQTENGLDYCWTGAGEDIQFTLDFPRDVVNKLTIQIHSLIKPSFGKGMKVFADGERIKHLFRFQRGTFTVSCRLPPVKNSRKTKIKISLPGTFSPRELGLSDDQRKLGIAIHQIQFGKADSRFSHFLRQLKVKS